MNVNLTAMKKNYFAFLLAVLGGFLPLGSVSAQIMPPELYVLQVYPTTPSATDSVFVSLTYTSNDGCPDYYLEIDSVESFMVSVAVRKIDNSKKVCTLAFTKFMTRINLGPLRQSTRIYVDGKLIQTINPYCALDKKGVVVKGTGACADKLFISEHTPYATLLPVLYSIDKVVVKKGDAVVPYKLMLGDEVRFGGSLGVRDTSTAKCLVAGEALCCEVISSLPGCVMNKTGVVVKGIDGCTGLWLVRDLSPVYSYPRMYLFKNDGLIKEGTKIMFGATEYTRDSTTSILCPIFGVVKCFFPAEPINLDTLAGAAYTADSLVKAGTAILLQKGLRKAMRACPLKNGKFEFPNIPNAEYTVYIIPDKKLNPDYLPTFYINKLAYKNADYYTLKDGRNEIAVNLRKFERRPGKGKIYGNVYFETANLKDSVLNYYGEKNYLYTTDNNTAINMPVILFNSTGTPIAWTMSDESGNYAFEDIALDSYRLVTETAETGAETSVVLSSENAIVGADMVLKSQDVIEALATPQAESFKMSPNPASDRLSIQSGSTEAVRIFNSLGQLNLEQQLNVGNNALNLQNLKPGVYFVKVGMHTQKLIRK